ncbi:MAG: beta-galactosidase [Bdellovibrionota bacterium]
MSKITALLVSLVLMMSALTAATSHAGVISFQNDQLLIDGQPQPQLFGAELQYFRIRGGYDRNVPRAKVMELWGKALDRMVEAKMNAVSFYIPWDFHEYAEGKFDFTGTVDEDGDGNPDYPSRDVLTFFKMIEQRGIKRIMARPGPYINAEWGFLGFGAVPKWFSDKYPNSKMRTSSGLASKLYDYHNADLLRHTELWFKELNAKVLGDKIGAGKPVSFLQLDNETNFQWQSIFTADYGDPAIARYRDFLKARHQSIATLNAIHGRQWASFAHVQPPRMPGGNLAEDQDWYRFQDESIRSYLEKIRRVWESIGVKEPTVLFTLAESYNAAGHGLLPNFKFRNEPGRTGLMTVNLYPKTYELPSRPLLNLPFKADHDVKAADSANDLYLGSNQEWVMGPEIQAGWWRGIGVSTEARRQTYLTTLGHGLKALFVYYFNEGWNWQVEKGSFPQQDKELYFDSPLDKDLNPRPHFADLKRLGEVLTGPHAEFLGRARGMIDPVCFLREDEQHAYSPNSKIDALMMNGEWAGGFLGYLLQTGLNPKILHWGLNSEAELQACKIVFRQDNGVVNPARTAALSRLLALGHVVVNLVDSTLAKELGIDDGKRDQSSIGIAQVSFGGANFTSRGTPLFSFDLGKAPGCRALLNKGSATVGYSCDVGPGQLHQFGTVFYDRYNSDNYGAMKDVLAQKSLLESLLRKSGITPRVNLVKGGDRVVAFGRTDGSTFMVTVKSGLASSTQTMIAIAEVDKAKSYRIHDLFSGRISDMAGSALATTGVAVDLGAHGSTAITIVPAP